MKARSWLWRWYVAAGKKLERTPISQIRVRSLPVAYWLNQLARRLLFSAHSERVGLVNGCKMLFPADSLFYFVMVCGDYEPATTRLLREILSPGMTFVDVGAHYGYYTLLAASRVGSTGKVVSFEASPSNFGILVRNISMNAFNNVTAIQRAVWMTTGETRTLFTHRLDPGSHSLLPSPGTDANGWPVMTVALDDYFQASGWPSVDVVKMDVEGAEPFVIQGMTQLLQRNANVRLILEFYPEGLRASGIDSNEMLKRVTDFGFNVEVITQAGRVPLSSSSLRATRRRAVNLYCVRPGRLTDRLESRVSPEFRRG